MCDIIDVFRNTLKQTYVLESDLGLCVITTTENEFEGEMLITSFELLSVETSTQSERDNFQGCGVVSPSTLVCPWTADALWMKAW